MGNKTCRDRLKLAAMQGPNRASDKGFTHIGQLCLFDEVRKVQTRLGHHGPGNQDTGKALLQQPERVDLR